MRAEVLAHVRELSNGDWLGHELRDHLESVQRMASQFAKSTQVCRTGIPASSLVRLLTA